MRVNQCTISSCFIIVFDTRSLVELISFILQYNLLFFIQTKQKRPRRMLFLSPIICFWSAAPHHISLTNTRPIRSIDEFSFNQFSNDNRSSIVHGILRILLSHIGNREPCHGAENSDLNRSKDRKSRKRESLETFSLFRIIHVGVMCTLIGRVWGSRLRLRWAWLSLLWHNRRLYHRLLFGYWRGWSVLSWRHPFVYSVQTLRLGERSDFVVRRETLESCEQ